MDEDIIEGVEAVLPTKDPTDANVPVGFNVTSYLRKKLNEAVVSATWTCTPNGLTFVSDGDLNPGNIIETTVAGGVANTTYILSCTFETSEGVTYQRSLALPVVER